MKIVEFYKQGAQVQLPGRASNMRTSFTAKRGSGEPTEIGYEPKSNSKKAEGAAHDTLDYRGHTHLLLKGGHVYSVLVGDSDERHTISAEEGHVSVPLPIGTKVEVEEYDPEKHGAPDPTSDVEITDEDMEGREGEQVDTSDPDANATEDDAGATESAPQATADGEGTLGNEEGVSTPEIEE